MDMFLGHTVAYWVELEKRAKKLRLDKLLQENVELRGKLNFCENRITEMEEVLGITPTKTDKQ